MLLIYDGDCGFCTWMAEVVCREIRADAGDFDVVAYQDTDLDAIGLTAAECDAALQCVGADGRVSSGAEAVARLLAAGRGRTRPLGWLIGLPGVRSLAGIGYRAVARNRHRLPGATGACATPRDGIL